MYSICFILTSSFPLPVPLGGCGFDCKLWEWERSRRRGSSVLVRSWLVLHTQGIYIPVASGEKMAEPD